MNEEHNRWDEQHRTACVDCNDLWLDEAREMQLEAELDAMLADDELANEIERA